MSKTHSLLRLLRGLLMLGLFGLLLPLRAEPYLAVQAGLKCVACHVNATGGGLRNALGNAFAQRSLPANTLPEDWYRWNGAVTDYLRLGGDYRGSQQRASMPGQASQRDSGTDQFRLYGELKLLSEHAALVLDESVAPGKAQRQEAYLRLATQGQAWYLKAGQFYLPFGWRLQDSSSLVRSTSGINMSVPDKGVELGLERDQWSAQLSYTRGPGNKGMGSGHQLGAQLVHLQDWGRLGLAWASTAARAGDRRAIGVFAGANQGPVSYLVELDLVSDEGFPEGRRRMLASLAEANWLITQGHNLKLTLESLDPDRRVAHDRKVRHSLVYEYTPIPYLQLRAGLRRHDGIPQNAFDNRRQSFLELHGFF
ncbi:hypothetical protein [Pelomonas sp. SE-A7]|uniref:hypothetical protein n=1 Tax=Pelomonas sp. SE-A7 TaxID=3054953 RepID=UPI00259D05DA|nr:hypothetical protein [Pelomonas sp. SE-A7]MDM4765389.1 hypothetical protein [Pelomonas sp. SE-A7]